jgi:hypothetical protein
MMRKLLLGLSAAACLCLETQAQTELSYSLSFRTDALGFHVDVTLGKGSTCFGISLYHSTDPSQGYVQVQDIAGVCGSSDAATYYTLDHSSPLPFDSNYYYLEFKGFGQSLPFSQFYVPFERSQIATLIDHQWIWVYNQDMGFRAMRVDLYSMQGQIRASATFSSGRASIPVFLAKGRASLMVIQLENGQYITTKIYIPE